jgi:hypothetical protein
MTRNASTRGYVNHRTAPYESDFFDSFVAEVGWRLGAPMAQKAAPPEEPH